MRELVYARRRRRAIAGSGRLRFRGRWRVALGQYRGQRSEKKARTSFVSSGDLPDAKRLHQGLSLKNRDDFGNMGSILDYGTLQYRLKQSLPLFLYDLLGFVLRVL
jgi:hypothetical protein